MSWKKGKITQPQQQHHHHNTIQSDRLSFVGIENQTVEQFGILMVGKEIVQVQTIETSDSRDILLWCYTKITIKKGFEKANRFLDNLARQV